MPPSASDAFNALQSFNSSRPAAGDYIKQANDQYGVSGLQGNVSNLQGLVGNLQNAVAAVNPSVTGRTSGNFTTEGQRSALVNREQAPILTNLGQQQTGLTNAQSNLSNAQGLSSQMASALMQGDQAKYQGLLDQYNAAESADQYNRTLAEQQRQFNLTPRGTSGGSGLDLSSLFGGDTSTAPGGAGHVSSAYTATNPTQAIANAGMADIQRFTQNPQSALSDFKATLSSAVRGNINDKAKVAAYFKANPFGLFNNNYQSVVQQLMDNTARKGALASPTALTNYLIGQLPAQTQQVQHR